MSLEWEIIKGLSITLIAMFCWFLKDKQRHNEKDIYHLHREVDKLKESYTSKETVKELMGHLEHRIDSVEKNLSEKIDLFLKTL